MSEDEIEILEDIESYSPSIQNIDIVITALATLHIFAGIIAIPIAYVLLVGNIFQAPLIIVIMILVDISVLITSVPLYFIIGWAIWSLQPWAWKVAVFANSIFLIINLIGEIILPGLMNIVFLLALFSSDVKLALIPIDQ